MKLYNYWRSSSSWRVRIGLHWKKQPFVYLPVHLLKDGGQQKTEAYARLNPMQSVPLLEVEDAGRLLHIAQSVAILEYLEERFPEPALLPGDRVARARVRQAVEIINSGIQPYQNTSVQKHVKHELHGDEKAWARHFIELTGEDIKLNSTASHWL